MKMLCGCLLLLSGADIWSHEVILRSHAASTSAPSNVALGGNASQSGTFEDFYASFAIDGNRDTYFPNRACSSTEESVQPWWRVDLLGVYQISSIVITNRADCCPARIIGAEIRIGNSLDNNGNNNPICAIISSMPDTWTFTITCQMYGRYVNVINPGSGTIVTLCEVEVYGVPAPVTKKKYLRIKFHTSEDMTDSTASDAVLQQLKSAMVNKGVSAVQLYWTRQPELEKKVDGSKPCDVN